MPLLAGLSTLLFGLSESAVEVLTLCLSSWTFPLGLSRPERTPLAVRAVLPGVCVLHRLLLAALDLFAVFDGSSGLRGLAGGSESKFGALDNFSARGFVRFTKLRESGFGGAAVRVFLADWDLFLVLLGSIGGFEVLFVWTIRHLALSQIVDGQAARRGKGRACCHDIVSTVMGENTCSVKCG